MRSRRVVHALSRKPSVTGNNLQLSLDIRLQKIAEDAFGSKRGALVAIRPTATGDVPPSSANRVTTPTCLSMASTRKTGSAQHLRGQTFAHRPLRGAYPPGSTYKPFMALMAQGWAFGQRNRRSAIPASFASAAATGAMTRWAVTAPLIW